MWQKRYSREGGCLVAPRVVSAETVPAHLLKSSIDVAVLRYRKAGARGTTACSGTLMSSLGLETPACNATLEQFCQQLML